MPGTVRRAGDALRDRQTVPVAIELTLYWEGTLKNGFSTKNLVTMVVHAEIELEGASNGTLDRALGMRRPSKKASPRE